MWTPDRLICDKLAHDAALMVRCMEQDDRLKATYVVNILSLVCDLPDFAFWHGGLPQFAVCASPDIHH